jgi:hypothetical protein
MSRTSTGRLKAWLDWWPDDVVATLLPDPDMRDALRQDMPRVPRAFYDEVVPVPDGWTAWPCAYLKLSEAYETAFDAAGEYGWVRREIDATHLSPLTEPERVADKVEALLARMRDTPTPRQE